MTAKLWVREALWLFRDETGRSPTWAEAIEEVAGWAMCGPMDAEHRILKALRHDEAVATLDDNMEWRMDLGPTGENDKPWFRRLMAKAKVKR